LQQPSGKIGTYIVPIYRGVKVDDRIIATRPTGTGFILADGVVVTCWHCVNEARGEDDVYLAYPVDDNGTTYSVSYPVLELAQDQNGSDLALGRIAFRPMAPGLILARESVGLGGDVMSYGYPFTTPRPGGPGSGFIMEPRLFRGYVTILMNEEVPGWGAVPTIECDMPAPAGMSGAPLLDPITKVILGVVYGDCTMQTEDRAPVTFMRAHHLPTVNSASGPATRGMALSEYIKGLDSTTRQE
jgi:Trypsin-like peptidase domain